MSSSESDVDMLNLLSDRDAESSDEYGVRDRVYKQRVDYLSTLDSAEFQLRFRLDKQSVQQLLFEIYPHMRVTGNRLVLLFSTLKFICYYRGTTL